MVRPEFVALLRCPDDRGAVETRAGRLTCVVCGRTFPVIDGVVSFVEDGDLAEGPTAGPDGDDEWSTLPVEGYTTAVEFPPLLRQLGRPGTGPVLDHGAGAGRLTEILVEELGQPVVAVDYSLASLRILAHRCRGLDVLAVHADARRLPLADGAFAAAASAGLHPLFRPAERRVVNEELARVLRPGAPAVISTLNYNLLFRLWALKGNPGARQGEHLHGSHFYQRLTTGEFRQELSETFEVLDLVGGRNIPGRTIAAAISRLLPSRTRERTADLLTRSLARADVAISRTPLSLLTGFMLSARVTKRADLAASPAPGQHLSDTDLRSFA